MLDHSTFSESLKPTFGFYQVMGHLGVVFPENWTHMKDGEFFELVKVDATSKEFLDVASDFSKKISGSFGVNRVKVR